MNSVSLKDLLEHVSEVYGVPVIDIVSARRNRWIIPARQAYCWLARHYTPKSYPEIGRAIGSRDHTTIMHSVKRVQRAIDAGEMEPPQPPQNVRPRVRVRWIVEEGQPTYDCPADILAWQKSWKPKVQVYFAALPFLKNQPVKRRYRPAPIIWRDRPQNVTAALMGDPAPWRSALAMEKAE